MLRLLLANARLRRLIADFGMSKFETNLATMTMCPGTAVYMSPEALNTPPVYTEKLDVFSLGVLMLQIMTRTFPHPTSRLAAKEVIDPTNHGKIIEALVIVPEGQRRIAQLTRVDSTHPLLPIAQQCIRDIDTTRPSAADMCGILTCVRESRKYKTSATREQEGLKDNRRKENEEMQQMKQELQETTEKLKNAQKEIQKLTGEGSKERSLWRRQGNYLVHTLSVGNNATDSKPLAERPTRHSAGGTSSPCISSPTSPLFPPRPNTGDWKPLPDCPITVHAGSSTVVGSKAYFQNKESGAIVEYDSTNRLWSLTPFHTLKQCGLACFENTLITVGGYDDQSKTSNKLFSLVDKKWKETLPSMSTPRDGPTVVSTDTSIIVAGGKNKFQMPLKTVEVFGVSSKQWTTAKPLPFPLYQASAAVHDGYVYMTAGEEGYNQRAVIRISIDALHTRENVYTNTSSFLCSNLEVQKSWESVCDLPVQYSTLADVNGHLLALGGSNPPKINPPSALVRGTQAVYEYSSAQNTWRAVSHMTIGRYRCLAAVLPGSNLIVVGGVSSGHERAKCTEYMTMND